MEIDFKALKEKQRKKYNILSVKEMETVIGCIENGIRPCFAVDNGLFPGFDRRIIKDLFYRTRAKLKDGIPKEKILERVKRQNEGLKR